MQVSLELNPIHTQNMKGIAIIAMLWHHLFTTPLSLFAGEIDNLPDFSSLTIFLGVLGKVCVSIFLFVSGYGLTVQFSKVFVQVNGVRDGIVDTMAFIVKRFIKFYAAYWFIFLIFVPIGVFAFDRTFADAYGQVNILKRIVYDLLGVQSPPYNITWWFNKLIIFCYIAFPFIFYLVRRMWPVAVLLVLVLSYYKVGIGVDFSIWIIPFFVGILYADKSKYIEEYLNKHNVSNVIICFVAVIGLLFFVYLRETSIKYFSGVNSDTYITVAVALIVSNVKIKKWGGRIIVSSFAVLGRHSANMYMVHTFFFLYWFPSFFYSFKYAPLIFAVLLLVSYCTSLLINKTKDALGVNKVVDITINRVNKNERRF